MENKKLGDVLLKTETTDPSRSPESEFDYIDVSSVSNETLKIEETQRLKGKDAPSRARRLVRENDVLFATIRPTLRRIAIVTKELDEQVCSTGYFVLRTKAELDFRFVFYFLQTADFMGAMEKLQKGASYPAVSDGDIRSQIIPVPPIEEQKRIVGVLDQAFEGIAAAVTTAENNLRNARALFDSHLQTVFTQKGEGWVEKTLGDEVEFAAGFAFKSTRYINDADNGIRLLRGDNIMQGEFRWEDAVYWPTKDTKEYERFRLEANDIVLAMDRPWVAAGLKIACVSSSDLPCLQVQRTARLRVSDRLYWRYLFHLLRSQKFVSYLLDGQTGLRSTAY